MATERNEVKRNEWRCRVAEIAPHRLKFVDEAGSHLSMTRAYGWAPRGTACVAPVPCNRGKNQSMLAMMGLEGTFVCDVQTGSVNATVFTTFIRERVLPHLVAGDIVVMDNARIHKAELLLPLLQEAGCFLLFLPSYSPDFSPIELGWSKVKGVIRAREPRDVASLHQAIAHGVACVTPKDIAAFFAHCGYTTENENRTNSK